MDITFNCTGCGQRVVVDEAGAGRQVQCPKCGQTLTVPNQSKTSIPLPTFSTPGEGLKTRDGKPSDSWEIAGTDSKFVPATAEISGNKVTLTTTSVDQPAFVRLGWKSDSNCNLVNRAPLPAMPFSVAVPNGNK